MIAQRHIEKASLRWREAERDKQHASTYTYEGHLLRRRLYHTMSRCADIVLSPRYLAYERAIEVNL